jgi:hypothetical protein
VRIVQEGIQAARAQGSRWLLIEWVELTAESVARVRAFRNEQMPELGLAFVAHSLSELGAAANELGALVVFSSLRAEESGWPAWMSALSVEEAQFHRKTFAPGENLIYLRE